MGLSAIFLSSPDERVSFSITYGGIFRPEIQRRGAIFPSESVPGEADTLVECPPVDFVPCSWHLKQMLEGMLSLAVMRCFLAA